MNLAQFIADASPETRERMQAELFIWLLSDRLSNYGYRPRDFRRLQSQRQRVKRRLKRYKIGILDNAVQNSRLSYSPEKGWNYTVGQSHNEEFTNLIADLCEYPKRGWLS